MHMQSDWCCLSVCPSSTFKHFTNFYTCRGMCRICVPSFGCHSLISDLYITGLGIDWDFKIQNLIKRATKPQSTKPTSKEQPHTAKGHTEGSQQPTGMWRGACCMHTGTIRKHTQSQKVHTVNKLWGVWKWAKHDVCNINYTTGSVAYGKAIMEAKWYFLRSRRQHSKDFYFQQLFPSGHRNEPRQVCLAVEAFPLA